MTNVIAHVDIDAFFASVEQLDNPDYGGKPVIVGAAPGRRGVVSSCSYEARNYGIRSAMPISEAYRRCPQGIYLPVRMSRYIELSERVMDLLLDFTPEFQQISIDEALLDLTGTERLFGPPLHAAKKMKCTVLEKLGLSISVGVAGNRYLAKLASEFDKPDGLYMVRSGSEEAFLDKLELKDIWGLGKKTLARLLELNITTVKELRSFALPVLSSFLGEAGGRYLYSAVRGKDPGIFASATRSHSLSSEVTFEVDRRDVTGIKQVLLSISHQIMNRSLREHSTSKTVFLKLRFHDFTTTTVQKTLKHPVASAEEIYSIAVTLLEQKWNFKTPIRLIGVGLANLKKNRSENQLELFSDGFEKRRRVEIAVTRLKEKHADVKITKGSLLKSKSRTDKRPPC